MESNSSPYETEHPVQEKTRNEVVRIAHEVARQELDARDVQLAGLAETAAAKATRGLLSVPHRTIQRMVENETTAWTDEQERQIERAREAHELQIAQAREQHEDLLERTRHDYFAEIEETRADLVAKLAVLVRAEIESQLPGLLPEPVQVLLPEAPRPIDIQGAAHATLPDLLLALRAHCHVLLVGPAGTGKSMLAKQAAEGLGLGFHALSLGPTTPMSKVFGYYDAHGNYHGTPFRRAFEDGGVMLLDELDNGHPGLLGELNQALALRVCAFADKMVTAHRDFHLVATANTFGSGGDQRYVGRQALDAATLDRFTMIEVPIDPKLERRLAHAHAPSKSHEVKRLLKEVQRLREAAERKHLPLIFSPRASIDGAKLLEAGATVEQALAWRVLRGLSDAHRTALGVR
jgi:cobaltochelatase CobS